MQVIEHTLEQVKFGAETTFRNLTMFPLLNGNSGEPDYLILDEALSLGEAKVTEVSAGGSVPELQLVNESDRPVFLLDGEELIGAKQNRILNLSILVAGKQSLVIPVSCVEQGRWAHQSAEFASSGRTHYARGRAMKMSQVTQSMVSAGSHYSDQGAVWEDIAAKSARLEAASPTHAMAAMYEQNATNLEDYVQAFAPIPGQVGALFAIDGAVIGLDLFDYAMTLQKLLPKLVRSYALDAIDSPAETPASASTASAAELLQAVIKADAQQFPAIGLGEDLRLTGVKVSGGALLAKERVIHLSAFCLEDEPENQTPSFNSRVSRASVRRSHYQS